MYVYSLLFHMYNAVKSHYYGCYTDPNDQRRVGQSIERRHVANMDLHGMAHGRGCKMINRRRLPNDEQINTSSRRSIDAILRETCHACALHQTTIDGGYTIRMYIQVIYTTIKSKKSSHSVYVELYSVVRFNRYRFHTVSQPFS